MNMIDGNEVVPYTTHNGIKIRKYADLALESSNMPPHKRGKLVLIFNIALGSEVKNRVFKGKKFMDEVKRDLPEVYLFTLGYFGEHDFVLDMNR